MTLNSNSAPRAFSWRRPLIVNAWLALTFLIAALWNIATALGSPYLQIDLLALTVGFLIEYLRRYHRKSRIAVREWLLVSAVGVVSGLLFSAIKFGLIGA